MSAKHTERFSITGRMRHLVNAKTLKQPLILANKSASPWRVLHRRWLIILTTIPLFAVFAAFGIAPQTVPAPVKTALVEETLSLPDIASGTSTSLDTSDTYWQSDFIRKDDTLSSLLNRMNIHDAEAISFLRTSREANPLVAQLRPGQPIQVQLSQDGLLQKLVYFPTNSNRFVIERQASGFSATASSASVQTLSVLKSARIENSLFGATDAANIPDQIAMQMVEIFSSDIDFHSDLRRGDHFTIVYESNLHEGSELSTGKILAAEFFNNGKTFRAILYRAADGTSGYYTPEGKSLHKSFLRSPLEFSRISSGFSLGRFHPILQKMRAHKGVDYAAPIGTRVKASGDAVVEFVGVKNGYGNVVVLRHANGINTVYGHLSHFASGLRKGIRVAQGEVIAFVGMTGLATGPHLHYEFLLHGEHRDPLKVALPAATPLLPHYQADFFTKCADLQAMLTLADPQRIAARVTE